MSRHSSSRRSAQRRAARTRSTRSAAGRSLYRRALRLEPLEDRRLLAVVTVTTVADTVDLNDGVTSLREAIATTNLVAGADSIIFAPSLTANGPATIVLSHGELAISGPLSINGPGANSLAIDASGNDLTPSLNNGDGSRVFNVDDGIATSFIDVSARDLTLMGADSSGYGGAVTTAESLVLERTNVRDNSAKIGGGIYSTGSLTVKQSVIEHNVATLNTILGGGGGIFSDGHRGTGAIRGVTTVDQTTIRGNSTAYEGGGIATWEGSIRVTNSLVSDNQATSSGGGMHVLVSSCELSNDTVTGNSRTGVVLNLGQLPGTVSYSTIAYNTETGIDVITAPGKSVRFDHTIVAQNQLAPGRLGDLEPLEGGTATLFHSLIGYESKVFPETTSGQQDANGNQIGGPVHGMIDAKLGPLANNGGPTMTHALLPGSPAIDAGNSTAVAGVGGVPTYDQRGTPFKRVLGGRIDVGAVESQPNPLPGDFNFDGIVDSADSTIWRDTIGSRVALGADANGDGEVNNPDFGVWKNNFGKTRPTGQDGGVVPASAAAPLGIAGSISAILTPATSVVTVTTLADTVDFNDGVTSLREAIFATNTVPGADTIEFAPALTAGGPATILLTQGEFKITDSVTINGPGADLLKIDASGNDPTPGVADHKGTRVLRIDDGNRNVTKEVSIFGVTLTGGDIYGSGGAVFNRESLTIANSKISGNTITGDRQGYGGGIYSGPQSLGDVVRLTVQDCEISGNRTDRFGGGIATRGGQLTVTGTSFVNNTANNGGGISTFGGMLTVSEATFSNNHANGTGGGIDSRNVGGTISSCDFGPNVAGSGGAIAVSIGNLLIDDCSFISNSAQTGNGGAIFNSNGDSILTIRQSLVHNNSASMQGGGIYGSVTIDRCEISFNHAGRDGGGIFSTQLHASDSLIGYNGADDDGGGIYSDQGNFVLRGVSLVGNSAGDSGGGAFRYSFRGATWIRESTISGNQARTGGGLYLFGLIGGATEIERSTIAGNNSTHFGGGVAFVGGYLSLDHCIVATNFAALGADLTGLLDTAVTARFSLIGISTNSGLAEAPIGSPDANGNLIGGPVNGSVDPLLGPLAYNGGPALPLNEYWTQALLPGSPAIDAGDPNVAAGVNGVPVFDQRGAPFLRVFGGRIDMGAVEWEPAGFLAGDYNGDRVVDAADYSLWADARGSVADLRADGNGDGIVDQRDFEVWKANFGSATAAGSGERGAGSGGGVSGELGVGSREVRGKAEGGGGKGEFFVAMGPNPVVRRVQAQPRPEAGAMYQIRRDDSLSARMAARKEWRSHARPFHDGEGSEANVEAIDCALEQLPRLRLL